MSTSLKLEAAVNEPSN